jgi:hypothetical protein
MIAWALRLAWLAITLVALLLVIERWFDPAPVLGQHARGTVSGGLSLMLDVLTAASHRAWALPAVIALGCLVVVLSAGAFARLSHQNVPWRRRRTVLWPLLGLAVSLLIGTMLDEHLPEFGQ